MTLNVIKVPNVITFAPKRSYDNIISQEIHFLCDNVFSVIINDQDDIDIVVIEETIIIIIIAIIIPQTHYEKSDWSRAFNQFTIACELDMINATADIAFIMSSSTSAWLPSPLECSQKQNG